MTKEGNMDPSLENTDLKMTMILMMCRWRSRNRDDDEAVRAPWTSELFRSRINLFHLLLKHGSLWSRPKHERCAREE